MRYQLQRRSTRWAGFVTLVVILVSAVSAGAREKPKPRVAKLTPGTRVLSLVPRPKTTSVASVAVSPDGDTLVVGQPGDFSDRSLTGTTSGSAYVFVRASHSSRWHQKAVLAAPDHGAGNGFGQAVAVSANGDEIAVGAPGASVGAHTDTGAVYVFTRPSGGWSSGASAASLTPSDPSDRKGMGDAVAISGSVVVAGNGHSQPVYLFAKQADRWTSETQTAVLSRPQAPNGCSGPPFNTFGGAVAVDGQTVAVGDTTYPSARNCNVSGAVFIFQRPSSGTWTDTATPTATLEAKDGAARSFVGQTVALQGRTLVAGAPDTMISGFPAVGAAYVFERPLSGWTNATETVRLTPSVPYASDLFGSTVAISGNTIVASNSFCGNGATACPFVYRKSASGWASGKKIRELVPPISSQRAGGLQPLAAGGNTAVQVTTIGTLPVIVFPLSKAGSST